MPRPRKTGPRTGCGRLSRAYKGPARDTGTPELQAKRIALVGDGDPALSVTAPGILHARGLLSRRRYDQAIRFRQIRCALYGPPWPTVTDAGGQIDHDTLLEFKAWFDLAVSALTDAQRAVLTDVCVLDRLPHWFFAAMPTDHAERARLLATLPGACQLLAGLDALMSVPDPWQCVEAADA